MLLYTAAVPPFMKNGLVIGCERTRQVVVIDPGDEVDDLLAHIRIEGLAPVAILLTHAHVDHVSGVARARRELQVPIWMHPDDRPIYAAAVDQGRLFGLDIEPLPPVDHYFAGDGMWGTVGDYDVSLRHTPGHCPGNVCFAFNRTGEAPASEGLVVGDTLFAGSIGRTDLPGGDYPTLMRAITEVLFSYPDDTVVFPGHGPDTTIGRERLSNPFVLDWMRQTGAR